MRALAVLVLLLLSTPAQAETCYQPNTLFTILFQSGHLPRLTLELADKEVIFFVRYDGHWEAFYIKGKTLCEFSNGENFALVERKPV